MCGITWGIFVWTSASRQKTQAVLDRSTAALLHRWPDCTWISIHMWSLPIAGHADSAYKTSANTMPYAVWLWQLRLAIIDLSPAGQQPMYYHTEIWAFSHTYRTEYIDTHATDSLCITFNGEIYNYQEIKTELEEKWYIFSTKSDTEVILASYHAYGPSCVEKFNGMWAFVIYDPLGWCVFCSRDRLWKKPFYYARTTEGIVFASEIKWLLASWCLPARTPALIDRESLELYLNLWYISSPRSIYTDIQKLPARHNLIISLKELPSSGLTSLVVPYDVIPPYTPVAPTRANRHLLIKEWKTLLADAVKIRMFTADVPVGAFLSGWLDSSSVVGEMTKRVDREKLNTFSVWFEWVYDESEYIHIVKDAFGTTHHHVYFTQEDFDSLLQKLAFQFDEPLWDPSIFPTYHVSQLARKHVTVSLSWDGGDEMFGWYPIHQIAYGIELLRSVPRFLVRITQKICAHLPWWRNPFKRFGKIAEACKLALLPKQFFFAELLSWTIYRSPAYKQWTTDRMSELLARNNGAFAQSVIDFDLFHNTLADNFLVKADRASMAHALEVRAPFLDWRFIAFTRKIPVARKATFSHSKILLRDIIRDIVPEVIVNRWKKGFTPPIEQRITQDKYLQEITRGIDHLRTRWLLSDERYQFYTKNVLSRSEQSFVVYKIRMFFLLQWMKERMKE